MLGYLVEKFYLEENKMKDQATPMLALRDINLDFQLMKMLM